MSRDDAAALTRPSVVRELAAALALRPSKALGQNFLVDGNVLRLLLDAAELRPDDRVLEIGAGLGALTQGLLDRAGRVVAIEKDARLVGHLRRVFADRPNLELLEADALDVDLSALLGAADKLVANLPYSVGSRILAEATRAGLAPACTVVTVQHEVAERLAARPATAARGVLSVWVQLTCDVELVHAVSAACFWPRPEVQSAIVRLRRRERPPAFAAGGARTCYALIRHAFTRRRKQMAGILAAAPGPLHVPRDRTGPLLAALDLDARARPEALETEQWVALANALTSRN